MKQLDRFEAEIKLATETQRQWRQRVNTKQTEVDSAKVRHRLLRPRTLHALTAYPSRHQAHNADLQGQLASLRAASSSDPGTSAKISVLTSRASTAERRLAATQAQLASAEEKLGEARTKVGIAEGKWEARLRELEARLRAAEEKVKRERQGAKERVAELADTIKYVFRFSSRRKVGTYWARRPLASFSRRTLEGLVSGAHRRDQQLGEVIKAKEKSREKVQE